MNIIKKVLAWMLNALKNDIREDVEDEQDNYGNVVAMLNEPGAII